MSSRKCLLDGESNPGLPRIVIGWQAEIMTTRPSGMAYVIFKLQLQLDHVMFLRGWKNGVAQTTGLSWEKLWAEPLSWFISSRSWPSPKFVLSTHFNWFAYDQEPFVPRSKTISPCNCFHLQLRFLWHSLLARTGTWTWGMYTLQ